MPCTVDNTTPKHYAFVMMLNNNRHQSICDAWVRDPSDAQSLAWHLLDCRADAVAIWYYDCDFVIANEEGK